VGLLAGLILGVSITLSKELLDTSIRRRDQAEDLGIPVVALIPRLQEHLRGGGPVVQRLFLAIRQDPASPVAESFRMLRAATSLATGGTQGRVLGITSPGVGEGKTLVTCNLATMYAQAGLRTLVIDCDLRRPAVARGFGLPASPGLSDVLEGRAELRDALRESGVAGLQLMTAGQRTPHASELLAGEGFQRLLATLRKDPEPGSLVRTPRFDVILLDLPPVAPVSETVVLGRLTSALYLLIRAGRTPHEVAADVLRRLEQAKVAVRGIVLNDVSKDDLGETARYLYYDYTDEGNNDDRRLWEKLTGQRRRRPSSSTATPVSPVEP
ncbi:MAG TPA: polysaccharide biosynthesis tyrosine autokinase, partial [bacterium]|nr:polysaccharide biosynthesis tyrosine autokinase [bacterium]